MTQDPYADELGAVLTPSAEVAVGVETTADRKQQLRSDIFAILRWHKVSEQCFAEVAMVTHAFATRGEQPRPTEVTCSTCRLTRDDPDSLFCSNGFHVTEATGKADVGAAS